MAMTGYNWTLTFIVRAFLAVQGIVWRASLRAGGYSR